MGPATDPEKADYVHDDKASSTLTTVERASLPKTTAESRLVRRMDTIVLPLLAVLTFLMVPCISINSSNLLISLTI